MGNLAPNLSALPPRQRQIWTQLATTPKDFVLYGGTALALRLGHRESVDFDLIAVASLRDIFGMKCATIPQRSEIKDYRDIHALIFQARIGLAEGIAAAAAIYGRQYNPVLTLQALAYFDDLPEPLPAGMKADLLAAVKSVSLQNLPQITATQRIGPDIVQA